ncbi:MAG: M23 family metallopeptidase [Solirubrobacterales bacterium]|nr:M23 family metallopeptidase [Solirubrobacterales bacterium]
MSSRLVQCGIVVAVLAGMGAPSALAQKTTGQASGGATAPEKPKVKAIACPTGKTTCRRGELLVVAGRGMEFATTVVFEGRKGRRDDRSARPTAAVGEMLTVEVPSSARSGRIKVVTRGIGASRSRTALRVKAKARVAPPAPDPTITGPSTFPIQGTWEILDTYVTKFGGGRGHQGQDVFAKCGTPLVAPTAAKVTHVKYHSAAGHYIVMKNADGHSYAMMHMLKKSPLSVGDELQPGTPVGQVGETGRASGCHLHFELWTAPGWYEGGEPIDPLPQLRAWAAAAGK